MFFTQVHPTVYEQLLPDLPKEHIYNPAHQQLVIWGDDDKALAKRIAIAQGIYEMNA